MIQIPELKCRHLTRTASDHSPLLLTLSEPVTHKSRFIFQKMWLEHSDFQTLVRTVWQEPAAGSPSAIVATKLRKLQWKLKAWNWAVFGDVRIQIADARTKIDTLETSIQEQYVEADFQ